MSATTLASAARTDAACDTTPAQRVTRSLLGYGIIAGPIYVTTSVVQALAHDGFDLSRHAWSQLAAGPQGWIQMANLILTGAMVIAFTALILATFVLARSFARSGARRLAWWSRITGIGFTVAFVGVSSGATGPAVILPFIAAVVAVWVWLAAVAVHAYRSVTNNG